MKKILLINSSTRNISNSRLLAHKVLEGIHFEEINLKNHYIKEVQDFRSSDYWPSQNDSYYSLIKLLKNSQIIIFSTPIYWYGISGLLKNFIDRWSESLKTDVSFRKIMSRKKFILIVVGGDNPIEKANIIRQQFQYISDFFDADFIDCVIGRSNIDITILRDNVALNKAKEINYYLKKIMRNGNDSI